MGQGQKSHSYLLLSEHPADLGPKLVDDWRWEGPERVRGRKKNVTGPVNTTFFKANVNNKRKVPILGPGLELTSVPYLHLVWPIPRELAS